MKKLIALTIAISTVMATAAFSADVVITNRGKKYHMPTCDMVQGKKTSTVDEQQAIHRGLKACPKCLKSKSQNEEKGHESRDNEVKK